MEKIYEQFSLGQSTIKLPYVNLPPDFIRDIKNKEFVKTIKSGPCGHTLRTHLKNVEIYKFINEKKEMIEKKNAVKKKCKCEIEFSNIWIYGDKYGIVWNISKIELLD